VSQDGLKGKGLVSRTYCSIQPNKGTADAYLGLIFYRNGEETANYLQLARASARSAAAALDERSRRTHLVSNIPRHAEYFAAGVVGTLPTIGLRVAAATSQQRQAADDSE